MTNKLGPTALLGTSADPPTCGHQALLEGLLNIFPKVATWASNNPMKCHGASLEKRSELLAALVNGIGNSNLELVQELSSPLAINTLKKASHRWPDTEFVFVVGSDLINHIPNWAQAKELLQHVRIGIVPREGWPVQEDQLKALKSLGGQIDLIHIKVPSSASSEIRSKTQTAHIPAAVLPIVLEQNLYGLSTFS